MGDPHRIDTPEALRERMGQASDLVAAKNVDHIDADAREYIERSPFLILSTSNAQGQLDASPKGDAPGFVWVENDSSIVIPDRKGNKLLYGLENILEQPQVGILFMIPGTNETLRINGRATLTADPELLDQLAARNQPALIAIRVHVEECFFHCAKAFLRSELWKPDSWQPIKVSMGRQIARRMGRADDAEVVGNIDAAIEKSNEDL